MAGSSTRDWDASTYTRVALPHEDWARAVLDRLGLEGSETVLDAGCGSGRTTAIVIERVPDGRTVCLGAHVERLPEDLRDRFVADVLAAQPSPLRLGYVRLNIEATAA